VKANDQFARQDKVFWANVRTISQSIGYTAQKQIKVPTISEIKAAFQEIGLSSSHIIDEHDGLSPFGQTLLAYFDYRATILNNTVKSYLMHVGQASQIFIELYEQLTPQCHIPINKQSGKKKAPALFTGIINMLIEANKAEFSCDYNPRQLTTVTDNAAPLRMFSRRFDGAFNRVVNPIAIWEIKEYYYTETFGSRVADGIYETLLDGMELEELREHTAAHVKHYLMVDGYKTWWDDGKSYLCRMIDMLHMGYVDEVLFGREVLERLPALVKEWVHEAEVRGEKPAATVSNKKSSKQKKLSKEEEQRLFVKEWVDQVKGQQMRASQGNSDIYKTDRGNQRRRIREESSAQQYLDWEQEEMDISDIL
jgi:hypothetical protein